MNSIKFRIAAKTDVGLVRQNNEDNFQASSDLNTYPMRWVNNEICSLGNKGALLVVADGMGGMNAGEVASEIAIETVKEFFQPENITDEVVKNRYSIEKFMNSAIEEADARIKKEAKDNPESRGMGTTIVIGWIFENKLYVSWCGDSRAYVYNPEAGLHQISKDHSYVQSLVDKGAISKEDAFDYPESNIITRCLCDSSTKAKPESLLSPYEICNNDIIMLCTDGLSGMIRDNEIETIIRNNEHDMDLCTDLLIQAACDAEGSDNITICVAQILQGANDCVPAVFDAFDKRLSGPTKKSKSSSTVIPSASEPKSKKIALFAALAVLCIAIAAFCCWKFCPCKNIPDNPTPKDTIKTEKAKATTSISDCNGNVLTIERKEGTPQIGDKAHPDGKFYMEDKSTIEVANGQIISINTYTEVQPAKEEVKVSEPKTSKEEKPAKKIEGILNGKLGKSKIDEENKAEDETLTPVESPNEPSENNVGFQTHVVQKGETLSSISRSYKVTPKAIMEYNQGIDINKLQIGTQIIIPIIRVK